MGERMPLTRNHGRDDGPSTEEGNVLPTACDARERFGVEGVRVWSSRVEDVQIYSPAL